MCIWFLSRYLVGLVFVYTSWFSLFSIVILFVKLVVSIPLACTSIFMFVSSPWFTCSGSRFIMVMYSPGYANVTSSLAPSAVVIAISPPSESSTFFLNVILASCLPTKSRFGGSVNFTGIVALVPGAIGMSSSDTSTYSCSAPLSSTPSSMFVELDDLSRKLTSLFIPFISSYSYL